MFFRDKNERSIVEFVIFLPLLLIITIFIIEVSLLFHNYLVITHLSRESARLGAEGGKNQHILEHINSGKSRLIKTYFLIGKILEEEISILPESELGRREGENISISIPYRIYLHIPYLGNVIDLKMTARSTMKIKKYNHLFHYNSSESLHKF